MLLDNILSKFIERGMIRYEFVLSI